MKSKKTAPKKTAVRRTVTKKTQDGMGISGFTLCLFFIVMMAAIVCIKYLRQNTGI